MVIALFISGVVVILIGLITGFLTGSFLGFLLSVIGGTVSALILFALAQMIDNQETILFKLEQQKILVEGLTEVENKTCLNCNHIYNPEMNSCPHCGRKE